MIRQGDTQASASTGGLTLAAMEQALLASPDVAALEKGNWRVKMAMTKVFELQKDNLTKKGVGSSSDQRENRVWPRLTIALTLALL